MIKIGTLNRLKHYWNRARLGLNSNYYTEYLRKQGVKIGKNSTVLYPSYIDGRLPYLLEIGDNVVVSINATILTHDAATSYAGDQVKVGLVTIHDHSFIGANCTILCDVDIGPESIVGAGSVVSRDVPPNSVYAGNPARFICKVDDFIQKHRESAGQVPFIEAKQFKHPYIEENKKTRLREKLRDSSGYFCSQLPMENTRRIGILTENIKDYRGKVDADSI